MRSKTFCVLPWIHAATLPDGNVQLCCVSGGGSGVNLNEHTLADYWNSEYVKDARRRMLTGQQVGACQHCYDEEAHGYESHRAVVTEGWQRRFGADATDRLIERTAPDGTLDAGLQYIDLRLGNTCNMQCVMCQPRESSRWFLAARKLTEISHDEELTRELKVQSAIDARRFEWYRNAGFWSNLKTFLPHVKEIILAGGEPFLIKEHFAFVAACCELGEACHIRLRYHTNATVFPEEMAAYWAQFEGVHFMVSIDGVGAVANYVRYPSDWREIEENIRRFDGLGENTATTFNVTTHALNVWRIPEICDWANSLELRSRKHFRDFQSFVSLSLVHHPAYLNIRVLPPGLKVVITARLSEYMRGALSGQASNQLTAILGFMNAEDQSWLMPSLVEYTKALDATRGTNFAATLPELAQFWAS